MKTILLLRHGKSDWSAEYGGDHERPLNERGQKAAGLMGRLLRSLEQVPDCVITSSAVRAHDTVRLAAESGEWDCPVEVTGDLYGASPESTLDLIRGRDDSLKSVLLAGHEPTWSLLAGALVGDARIKFPTAALARIDLDVKHWRDVGFGRATLVWHVTPKLLARTGL